MQIGHGAELEDDSMTAAFQGGVPSSGAAN